MSDPFATLGLDWSADLAAVRAARRRLALEFHPDHGGDKKRFLLTQRQFEEALEVVRQYSSKR